MPGPSPAPERDVTTLSARQRDWIRRQGQLARAIEAAQRRSSRRFAQRRGRAAPPRAAPGQLSLTTAYRMLSATPTTASRTRAPRRYHTGAISMV